MTTTLSIIIPHYNTPKLLDKMLSSIPKRDDVQVIVVDDNSEVGVQELLALKSKYDNIELYTSHYCTHSTGLCRCALNKAFRIKIKSGLVICI